jgi:hypothetical protein
LHKEVLDKYFTGVKNSYFDLTFKEYFRRLRAHFISSRKYLNLDILNKNDETKTILVASGGIFNPANPSIKYKPLDAKIHFFIQFEEKEDKLYPIEYGFTFYKDDTNQFRFDKEETKNDFVHPNCHLTVGNNKQRRYPTPCLDIFYLLFFIEEFKA